MAGPQRSTIRGVGFELQVAYVSVFDMIEATFERGGGGKKS